MKLNFDDNKYPINSNGLKAAKIILFVLYILSFVLAAVACALSFLRGWNYDASWKDVGKIVLMVTPALMALYVLVLLCMLYKAIYVVGTKSAVRTYSCSRSIKGMFIGFFFITIIALAPKILMWLNMIDKLAKFNDADFIQVILVGACVVIAFIGAIVAAILSSKSLKIINNVEKGNYEVADSKIKGKKQ